METDEREICIFLKSWPGQFVAGREIARRASGKRRWRNDPNWAVQPLSRLVEKGIVEDDAGGHYRLRPKEKKNAFKKSVSPQIRKILEQSGKTFVEIKVDEEEWEDL